MRMGAVGTGNVIATALAGETHITLLLMDCTTAIKGIVHTSLWKRLIRKLTTLVSTLITTIVMHGM